MKNFFLSLIIGLMLSACQSNVSMNEEIHSILLKEDSLSHGADPTLALVKSISPQSDSNVLIAKEMISKLAEQQRRVDSLSNCILNHLDDMQN